MKNFIFTSLLSALLFQGCSTSNSSNPQKKTSAKSSHQHVLKGHYIYGHEANSFQPCNQQEAFWLTGTEATLATLSTHHANNTSKAYEKIYIEINGEFIGKAKDGFAQDYDGQINVKKIYKARKASQKDCT